MQQLSIIIPVLDEEKTIGDALRALAPLRQRGAEVIVVDGGSRDRTIKIAKELTDQVTTAPRGRSKQMNAGAALARGVVLLFLHADTSLPPDADQLILAQTAAKQNVWGRFDVHIAGRSAWLGIISAMMNVRSRITGIATGDQAMFVTRETFIQAGRFPDIPLMEDIVFSKKLKRIGPPICLTQRVTTSGRRWEKHGIIRTMLTMWWLRFAFFAGVPAFDLAKQYDAGRHD